jgi:hypothetical protein
VGSASGLVGTLIFLFGIVGFTIFKVTRFLTGSNPLVVQSEEEDAYHQEDAVNLRESNMLFAF